MVRPFFVFGSAMFLSLLIFTSAGIYTAVGIGTAAAAAYIFLLIFKKNFKIKVYIQCISAAIFIAAVLFAGRYCCAVRPALSLADGEKHTVCGIVTDNTDESYGRYYYTLVLFDEKGGKSGVRTRFSSNKYVALNVGDEVKIEDAVFYETERYSGEDVFVGCYSQKLITLTRQNAKPFYLFVNKIKSAVTGAIVSGMPADTGGVCVALLTGDKSLVKDADILSFRYSGVSHLFAVSGLHLTIWTGVLFFILDSFTKRSNIFKSIVSSAFVVFFMFFTGFTRSVLRAGAMLLLYNSARLISKNTDSVNSLFCALTVLLIYNPFMCTDISLLMSFFSCLGLIVYAPQLSLVMGRYFFRFGSRPLRAILLFVNSSVSVSLSACLFTVVIAGLYFGSFSIVSPVTNLAAVPLAEAVMLLAAGGTAFSFVNAHGIFFAAADALCRALLRLTGSLSSFAECSIGLKNQTCLIAATIIFALFLLVLIIDFNNKTATASAGICAMLLIFVCGCASQYIAVKDDSITVMNSASSMTVVFKYSGGSCVLASSSGGDSGYLGITSALTSKRTDALILDASEGESQYLRAAFSQTAPHIGVMMPGIRDSELVSAAADFHSSSDCEIRADENIKIDYRKTDISAYVLYTGAKNSCVVSLDGEIPEISADLLIVRHSLPENIDLSRFRSIIIVCPDDEDMRGRTMGAASFSSYRDTLTYRNGAVR